MSKKRVLVAMSGGVDSSVALAKILDMGYEAIGITMKLWDNNKFEGSQFQESTCCGIEEITGAKLVCNHYGVPHILCLRCPHWFSPMVSGRLWLTKVDSLSREMQIWHQHVNFTVRF